MTYLTFYILYFSTCGGRIYYCLPIFASSPQKRIIHSWSVNWFQVWPYDLLWLIKFWAEVLSDTSRQKLRTGIFSAILSFPSVSVTGMFWIVFCSFSLGAAGLRVTIKYRASLLICCGHILWMRKTNLRFYRPLRF